MAHTIASLKAGFSIIMQPLVDYEFAANKKMQLSLLFTLPEVSSENAFNLRATGTNYVPTQWPLLWWSVTAQ